ncbi:DNA oxidative demethylase AlkB [Fodinicurvata halophila]|uniref:DNA oxidative demethylase AlkB n=1 Tax=Fodinicurvata halophila TaxID=1419723 RepID=A0ABV8UKF7_9PROT
MPSDSSPLLPGLFNAEDEPFSFAPGAVLFRGFAASETQDILAALERVTKQAPFRRMSTPGGRQMSVEMTNCGRYGWLTDRNGYRYEDRDPESGKTWPAMPPLFRRLARSAAEHAGYPGFEPDSCLINQYRPGARLTLHQDRDEQDFSAPIVSFSLGLPATFLFGGPKRSDRTQKILLTHGDALVWGGPSRLNHHGIQPLEEGRHPLVGDRRINLTFRKAR